jgi:eukaryotic-like serine/threonine-protein kinase
MDQNDDLLSSLLMKWEEAWEKGIDISLVKLCENNPELHADQLASLSHKIECLRKMSWMSTMGAIESPLPTSGEDQLLNKLLANRYRIDALVGAGGFGRVYKAFDTELHRFVAVKVARTERIKSPDDLLHEARRAAKLQHNGIVSVYDVGRDGEKVFIVSELIEGKNLAETIASERPNQEKSIRIVADVADALHYAHEQGFIHFDIKPSNILIDKNGTTLLTDFGIATSADQVIQGHSVTHGTLPYMAPEQLAGEYQLVDARTDIHALGVVLYELLTGQLPYQGRSTASIREEIIFRQPTLPTTIDSLIPKEIEAVCLKALSKHPKDRFADAGLMAAALKNASLESKLASGNIKSNTAHSTVVSRRQLFLGGAVIAVSSGLAGILGSVIGPTFLNRSSDTNDEKKLTIEPLLIFDGTSRILTELERFAPVTLEAWIRPNYNGNQSHFVIGSDIVSKYGIGLMISGVLLSVEVIPNDDIGVHLSEQVVQPLTWSHIAAVFGANDTKLFFNGRLVKVVQATKRMNGTRFVIGNAGENNPIDYFVGEIRSVRISKGERFKADFVPDQTFVKDTEDTPMKAVLIYDGVNVDGKKVIDTSGYGNDGVWEKLGER